MEITFYFINPHSSLVAAACRYFLTHTALLLKVTAEWRAERTPGLQDIRHIYRRSQPGSYKENIPL